MVVFGIRSHRVDDYRGHYRIWLWTAAAVPFVLMTSWVEVFYYSGVGVVPTVAASLPWFGITLLGLTPGPMAMVLQAARDRRVLHLRIVEPGDGADEGMVLLPPGRIFERRAKLLQRLVIEPERGLPREDALVRPRELEVVRQPRAVDVR